MITADFLRVLRLAPARGRFFNPDEFTPGQDAVILVSHGLWQQRFGGDPEILGRTLFISGRKRLVVGVMPETFTFPGKTRIWAPFAPDEAARSQRDLHTLQVFARLKPSATVEQAQAELATLTTRYARDHPQTDADWSCVGFPMLEDAVAQIRPALLVLLASVLALLLIACANVTNLLLARAATRRREMSLRDALVVGQVAATVVLLICSGLLLRSFHQLQQVDAGFVAETPVQAYEPYHQFSFNNITVVARAKSHPEDLTTAMRQQVLSIDPQQPVHTEKTMARIVEDSLGQRYFSLLLVGAFALVALLLAVVGLYGVISYGVARRTREFGVRLSIGASRRDIASMVLAQSSRLIGAGLAIGLLGALFSARLLHSLLYGIGARDPFTFAGVIVLLGAVAVAACLIPALRAARVNPAVALRDE